MSLRETLGAPGASSLLVFAVLALMGAAPEGVARDAGTKPTYHLLFTSERDGDDDIYAVDTVSTRVAALTQNNFDDWGLAVTPSGHFYVDRVGTGALLVSPDGRREKRLGSVGLADAALAPGGRRLAIGRETYYGSEIYRIALVDVPTGSMRMFGPGTPDAFSRDRRYLGFWLYGQPGLLNLQTRRRSLFSRPNSDNWVWSPLLTRYAFVQDSPTGENELVVVGARPRTGAKRILHGNLGEWRWLDERRIGITRHGSGDGAELVVLDLKRQTERVVAQGEIGSAAWSPTGDAVAYVAAGSIHVGQLEEGTSRRVRGLRQGASLTWSPSGDRIAAVGYAGELAVLQVRPTWRFVRIATRPERSYSVVWSPDERTLALAQVHGVALVPAAGGRVRRTEFHGEPPDRLAWANGPIPATAATVAPIAPSEQGGRVLRSRAAILEIAASGRWVGAIIERSKADCTHVLAWQPGRRVVRFQRQEPCDDPDLLVQLELRGTHLTWYSWYPTCGASCTLDWNLADVRRPGRFGTAEGREASAPPPRPRPPRGTHRGLTMSLSAGTVVVQRNADRKQTTIRVQTRIVDAELEDSGLFYAWNDARGSGRVAFIPLKELRRRLR